MEFFRKFHKLFPQTKKFHKPTLWNFFSTKSLCGICKSQNITFRGGNLKRWKTHGQLYNENIMQSSTNMTAAQASKKFPTMLRKNILNGKWKLETSCSLQEGGMGHLIPAEQERGDQIVAEV